MSHVGYLYEVRLTRRYTRGDRQEQMFGNCVYKGDTTWFGEAVRDEFAKIDERSLRDRPDDDETEDRKIPDSVATFERHLKMPEDSSQQEINMVGASLLVREYGVRAMMSLAAVDTDDLVPRTEDDHQSNRVAIAARFPRGGTRGVLLIHRNAGKTALRAARKAIKGAAAACDLTADIHPLVVSQDLLNAVESGRVTALRMNPAKAHQMFSGSKSQEVQIALDVSTRHGFLGIPSTLKAFILRNERRSTVELDGDVYGEVRVTVRLENGSTRSFTVGSPEQGFAFGYDLDLGPGRADNLGPSPTQLARSAALLLTS